MCRSLVPLALFAALAAAQEPKEDKPETPPWKRLAEMGKQDRRLEGYRAPEGFKVEVVADAPAVSNPVALAFTDDGTPLVVERTADDKATLVEETFKFKDGSTRTIRVVKKAKK